MTADDRSPGTAADSSALVARMGSWLPRMPWWSRPNDGWDALRRRAYDGPVLEGYRNRNYRIDVPKALARRLSLQEGTPVKIRVPVSAGYAFDQAVWPDEAAVLDALKEHLTVIPQVLMTKAGYSVQTFVQGDVFSGELLRPVTAEDPVLRGIARFFATLAKIPCADLPESPEGWPADGDCSGFLRTLVEYTEEEVRRPLWSRYGSLLEELGFPENAMIRFHDAVPQLTRRPFVLLHADMHPGNMIRALDGELHVIDWELAMVGDPLHDLAIHLTRSRYTRNDRRKFIGSWVEEVGEVNRDAVQGLRQDLPWYLAYQRVRSVYTDVVRTVEAFADDPTPAALKDATRELRRIVGRTPLDICPAPSYGLARSALLRWHADNGGRGRRRAADRVRGGGSQ